MDILQKEVDEVSYPLGDKDRYIDETRDILKTMSTYSNEEVDGIKIC